MKKKGLDHTKQKFHPHQLRGVWKAAKEEIERQPRSLSNLRDHMTSFLPDDDEEEFVFESTSTAPLDPE